MSERRLESLVWTDENRPTCREELATALREAIRRGELAPGAAVPSERDLCDRTGLARGTVRSALDLIQSEGGIVCSHGRRRTVAANRVATRTLAVLANDPYPRADLWRWPGIDAWLQFGFAQAAFASGWHVLTLHPAPLLDSGGTGIQASGMLLSTTAFHVGGTGRLVEDLRRHRLPMVGVSNDPSLSATDRVVHDHAAGCAALVRALAARGARRILPWWGRRMDRDPWWLSAREEGYRRACMDLGLPMLKPRMRVDPSSADTSWDAQAAAEASEIAPVLDGPNPPDALLMVNDICAHIMAHALRGLGCGSGMPMIAGYDASGRFEVPETMPDWRPTLTVDRGNPVIASLAVGLLLDRLAGRLPARAQCRLVPPAALRDANDHPV